MKSTMFKMKRDEYDDDTKEYTVYGERFNSMAELKRTVIPRDLVVEDSDDDFFHEDEPHNPHWQGFRDQEELFRLIDHGVEDPDLVGKVVKYARQAETDMKEKYCKRTMDVVGGAVNVPLMLAGDPMCMHSVKRARVPTKVLRLGLLTKTISTYSADDFLKMGVIIAETIAGLEKAGYRVAVDSLDAWRSNDPGYDDRICALSVKIKESHEPMNPHRFLFPLTSMAFHRGVGFGWVVCNEHFDPYCTSLGGSCDVWFPDNTDRKMEELFRQVVSKEARILNYATLIDMMNDKGPEEVRKYISALLMKM